MHDHISACTCQYYNTILEPMHAMSELDYSFHSQLKKVKIIAAYTEPICSHALGATTKADGTSLPITECHRPLGTGINNNVYEIYSEIKRYPARTRRFFHNQ